MSKEQELIDAVAKGEAIKVASLLTKVSPDTLFNGSPVLCIAAQRGYQEVVAILLHAGATIDLATTGGATALFAAAFNGHQEVVAILLRQGARVDSAMHTGATPLFAAAFNGWQAIVAILLRAGAQVAWAIHDGSTPLMIAAEHGHKEVVELLLQAGAQVDVVSKNGITPLMIAVFNGHQEVVALLLRAGAQVAVTDKYGRTPLMIAVQKGHQEVVALLLQAGAQIEVVARGGVRPLSIAAQRGYPEIVALLLRARAQIDLVTNGGVTPLFAAAHEGHLEVVALLLRAGANLALADNYGRTPLMIAAAKGHTEIAALLQRAQEACLVLRNKLQRLLHENTQLMILIAKSEHSDVAAFTKEPSISSCNEAELEETVLLFARWQKLLQDALKTKAEVYCFTAKLAFLSTKYEEAICNYQLAVEIYTELFTQGIDYRYRLEELKVHIATAQRLRDLMVARRSLISYQELSPARFLGAGGCGSVYQGRFQGREVAIKELYLQTLPESLVQEFSREAEVLVSLRAPQLVALYGICIASGHLSLVMEYMPQGSLYKVLESAQELLWHIRWQVILDISLGLEFLHKHGILHRNLRSLNVLFDSDLRAKLSDFGLTTLRTETVVACNGLAWMAPELFISGETMTQESDMYAYGMLLWEIAARKKPFADAEPQQIVGGIMRGEKEVIPGNCPIALAGLISRCWEERKMRPSIEEALALVKEVCGIR